MSSSAWTRVTIESLIASGTITAHKDGNYGSLYPRVEEFGANGVPFLTAKSLNAGEIDIEGAPRLADERADALRFGFVQPNDVLLSHNATIGRVAVVPQFEGRLLVGTSLTYFRLNPQNLLPRYFAAYLAGADFQNQLAAVMSHSTRNQVPITAQRTLTVVVPPLDVQHMIADTLGALDDKIEQNRRTGRALEGLARATFKAWFVDFEPVKAKAAGQTSFPGLPPAAFASLPDRLTDSPIGPVPEGWAVGKLGNFFEINKQSVRAGQIDGEIEYIDIASVTVGRLDGIQRVQFAEAPSRARRRVRHGDTIWSCVRPNRRSFLFIHSPPANRIASTGFAVLSPAALGPSYLHELTTRQEFVDYLVANADGSAYPAVRPEHFAAADVLVPPAVVREAFEDVTIPLRDLLAASEAESSKLAALRDYLLPQLLSGRVRVSNVERFSRKAL